MYYKKLAFITERLKEFYQKHQRLPTHGEMVKLMHYSSRGSTYYVVKQLMKKGIVAKDDKGKLVPKILF